MTINLENRKKVDFDLIATAAEKKPRTFTEFLHITKLPRKTLSLRLKELCKKGVLVKGDRKYKLNGDFDRKEHRDLMESLSETLSNKRIRAGFMLIAFLLCSSVSGYVFANFFMQSHPAQREAIGAFSMNLEIANVKDLYAWQVLVVFNPSELRITKITPGDFVGIEFPYFMNATSAEKGVLLLGGTLHGNIPGESGSGKLATIIFEFFMDEYEDPRIASEVGSFETQLLDSKGSVISNEDSTLRLVTAQDS